VIINDEMRTKRSLIIDDGSGIISVDDARPDVHEDEKWRKGQCALIHACVTSSGRASTGNIQGVRYSRPLISLAIEASSSSPLPRTLQKYVSILSSR
jgi:hypothetical protein